MREGTRPHPNRGSGRDGINMSIWIVTTMTYRPYILAFLLAALACTSCTFDVGNLWDKEEDVPPVLPVPDEPTPTSSIHDGGFVAYEPPVSPDPPVLPIGNTWHNHASAGWDVTLKDYLRSATRNDERDLLILMHSGHGTHKPDTSGDELDGRDEQICLHDGPVTDDVIHSMLSLVPPRVRIVFIADCCHSGTLARDAGSAILTAPDITRAVDRAFRGQMLYLGGCTDNRLSYGDAGGGFWSNALWACMDNDPDLDWGGLAERIIDELPGFLRRLQRPVVKWYGDVSDDFGNAKVWE